jgi:hypothetical protein
LLGLIAWVVFCRNFAEFSSILDLPGPRARLDGPYAALGESLFSAGPMVVWSLVVDKVHRRASTGIDWQRPRPVSSVIEVSIVKLAGLWAT